MKKLKRAVIKEELVELTGDFRPALILNQFIYWIERMYDADKYIHINDTISNNTIYVLLNLSSISFLDISIAIVIKVPIVGT